MPSTWSHVPFAFPQEDLQQPAPLQEDEAAKVEEEVAEAVGPGLLVLRGGPWASCFPPGAPEPSREPLDLQAPEPECEVSSWMAPSGQKGTDDTCPHPTQGGH